MNEVVTGRTSLSLLYLQCEIEGADGEVYGLGEHAPHLTQEVHDEPTLVTYQAGQQLGNPTREYNAHGLTIACSDKHFYVFVVP